MTNKTIVVTGSSSGLGASIRTELERNHYQVLGLDRNNAKSIDVTEEILPDEQIDVHGVINCAGTNRQDWFGDIRHADFRELMDTNVWSIINVTQRFLVRLIINQGFVCNIVSNASHTPMTCSALYNASKGAAAILTRQMARELTPKYGITVFSISPNKLRGTGMSKKIESEVIRTREWTPEYAAEYQRKALLTGKEIEPYVLARFIRRTIEDREGLLHLSGCDIPFGA